MSEKSFKSYREESRKNFGVDGTGLTHEQIQLGALLRIADASEKMALRHTELITQRDNFQRWYESEVAASRLLGRRLAAAKGQLTKMKKALAVEGGVA